MLTAEDFVEEKLKLNQSAREQGTGNGALNLCIENRRTRIYMNAKVNCYIPPRMTTALEISAHSPSMYVDNVHDAVDDEKSEAIFRPTAAPEFTSDSSSTGDYGISMRVRCDDLGGV